MCGGGGSPSSPSGGGAGAPGGTTECDRIRLVEVVEAILQGDGSIQHRGATSRAQYINLDPDPAHPEYGRRIRLRARVAWASGSNRSLAGQTVYWYFTAADGNRTGLPAQLGASFESEGGGRLRTTSTADASGWTNLVSFFPSQYGGDTFEVFATDNPGYSGGLSAGRYSVWRQLLWELDCMQRPGGAGTYSDRTDTARMNQKFRDLFIRLVPTGSDNSPAHRRMIKDADAAAWATGVRNGTGAPRYFHLCLIDTICWDPAPVTVNFQVTPDRYWIRLPCGQYLLEAGNWFVRATYRAADGATGALAEGDFVLTEAGSPATGDDRFLLAAFPPEGLERPVTVEVTFTNWTEGSGLQTGRSTLVGIRWRERHWRNSPSDINDSTLHTMVHEPGHALGLAAQKLPTGENNANYYVSPGGPHCNALANQCIMYAVNTPSLTLCSNCTDCTKGRNLASLPIGATAGYCDRGLLR